MWDRTNEALIMHTCIPAARVSLLHFLHPGLIPRVSKVNQKHKLNEDKTKCSSHPNVKPDWKRSSRRSPLDPHKTNPKQSQVCLIFNLSLLKLAEHGVIFFLINPTALFSSQTTSHVAFICYFVF